MEYNNRGLMLEILGHRIQIARAVNVGMISLDETPQAYKAFGRNASAALVDRDSCAKRKRLPRSQHHGNFASADDDFCDAAE